MSEGQAKRQAHPQRHHDVVIIGAGPAGLTAGIYAGRAQLSTVILEKGVAGGQIAQTDEVIAVEPDPAGGFWVRGRSADYHAGTVIVATGANPRLLGVPGEEEFYGRGVSTCATCDGFFYRGKHVVVVGGGDAAVEEGAFLTKFADRVTVVHRRDALRANKAAQERAFANPKMVFVWDTIVTEVLGHD